MDVGVYVFWGLVALGVAFGITRGLVVKLREDAHNNRLREFLDARDTAFEKGMLAGRKWLAQYIAEAEEARDGRDTYLRVKPHAGRKSAQIVQDVKREKRELQARLKLVEYQLRSYEEYFPLLEEYRDLILDERVPLAAGAQNVEELESSDPTMRYLSREEWDSLPSAARNQRALDKYVAREKSDWEIGRYYERYLGYLREENGWSVTYHGALRGFEDLGRDLICSSGSTVEIIQAKCWSRSKLIHEKHIFQLAGTVLQYRLEHPGVGVAPVLITTTELSPVARAAADALGVRVETVALPAGYPMIKCNISTASGERIYHLPFDQQYDRTKISRPDERYVATVAEAEALGFRRAWKHRAPETS